jgi:hypothetical protein
MDQMNLPGRLDNPKVFFQDDLHADPRIARVMGMMACEEGLGPHR